jgi:hypothetical protein
MRYIVIISTSNKIDFKEREEKAKRSYPDEQIYPDMNTAINSVIKNFNTKYFYHIFDIDACIFEPFTIDSQYLLELQKKERE